MFSGFSKKILTWLGWKMKGDYPEVPDKFVIIVIPHTSNWDFPLGLLLRSAWKADIRFVGKDSLFRFPYGFIFRWLGGIPVDRSKRSNFVDAVAELFKREGKLAICLAPEGTRKKVDQLKSGFYYIALKAGVPIVMVSFYFKTKTFGVSQPFYPSGNYEKDLLVLKDFYKGVEGKYKEKSYQFQN